MTLKVVFVSKTGPKRLSKLGTFAIIITTAHFFQGLGGVKAFKEAEKLIQSLDLGGIEKEFWTESVFNNTCPTVLVDWCKPNKIRAVTCKDVSIGNFIEAHEAVMKIKYKEIINLHSNNTYLLREAPRYSGKNLRCNVTCFLDINFNLH